MHRTVSTITHGACQSDSSRSLVARPRSPCPTSRGMVTGPVTPGGNRRRGTGGSHQQASGARSVWGTFNISSPRCLRTVDGRPSGPLWRR